MTFQGSKEEYQELHRWIRKNLGKASYCSNDMTHKSKMYDWANISHEYKRDLNDYKSLCRPCHAKIDGFAEVVGKRSIGNKYHNKKIKQFDKNWEFIKEWTSSSAVEDELKILHSSLSNVLAGRAKTAGGYRWLH